MDNTKKFIKDNANFEIKTINKQSKLIDIITKDMKSKHSRKLIRKLAKQYPKDFRKYHQIIKETELIMSARKDPEETVKLAGSVLTGMSCASVIIIVGLILAFVF